MLKGIKFPKNKTPSISKELLDFKQLEEKVTTSDFQAIAAAKASRLISGKTASKNLRQKQWEISEVFLSFAYKKTSLKAATLEISKIMRRK